ncbi:MAG: tetratricopeptide repeat protein [Sedimentisphaerales bacterium]
MAKRLNKKVAIIGSLAIAVIALLVIIALLYLSRSPEKYLADAQAQLALAQPDYNAVEKAYKQAFGYARKNIDLKIDILFKLSDMYNSTQQWPKGAGCWEQVINFDPKNLKARHALLDYTYQIALAGNWSVWKDVETHASELIDKELDKSPGIYRIKGQALLEQVRRGQMTDKEAAIKNVIEILQKVTQDEPNNVNTYQYLADAITLQGEILAAKGVLDASDNAHKEAVKILEKGVKNIPDEPKAYINLYNTQTIEASTNPDKYKELESSLINLTKKFSNNALAYYSLTQLYQTNWKDTDKAIQCINKATELDKQNVTYAIKAAELYYRRYSINKNEDDFQKGVDIARNALNYPDSLDIPGPRARINFVNRYLLHTFLADCFIERAIDATDAQPEKAKWIETAENEVYQISQLMASAENPYVMMWRGRLLLAKGQINDAVIKMNAAYEILTASGQAQRDIQLGKLSYELAGIFRNSSETGAVVQFYSTAVTNGLYFAKPEMLLDFASVLIFIKEWQSAIGAINTYEKLLPKNERSAILRTSAYIGANMFEQAQESLDKLSIEDPNVLRLKIALLNRKFIQTSIQLGRDANAIEQQSQPVENREQLKKEYDAITKERDNLMDKFASEKAAYLGENEAIEFCKTYVSEGQTGKAQKLVENLLHQHPDNINVKVFQLLLAEPQPVNVPPERLEQLMVKAAESINEPAKRAGILAQFYQDRKKEDKVVECYQQILQLEPNNNLAVAALFDIALKNEDFKQAEKMAEIARQNNIDLCGGEFFKARLAYTRKEYQKVIERVNTCLEKRPIFSMAYLLRSQAYSMCQKESEAIDDTRKAYNLNPLDSMITRNLAYLLYNRNRKLGASASSEQVSELRNALIVAIRTNPTDVRLQSSYAEYISDTDPQQAIAICQQIQKARPSVENSLILGRLALKMSTTAKIEAQAKAYLSMAEDAYEKAREIEPNDNRVIAAYSEFLATTGKTDKAEKNLAGRKDLLWQFYFRNGKYDEAKQLLTELYKAEPKDANILKGFILVSKAKEDAAEARKYVAELLKVDDSIDSRVLEIELCLEAGLVDEAQTKLESLSEKYPDEPRVMFLKTWFVAKQGKLEDALKLANKNLEADKNNPRVWRLRGQINLALNKINEAIDDLQKCKAIRDDADVRIDLAKAYMRNNREEEAIAELKTAADKQGSSAARALLERAYIMTGKQDQLAKFYLETIEKYPSSAYWYNQAAELALLQKDYEKAYAYFDSAFQNSLKVNSESPDEQSFEGKLRVLLESKKYDQLLSEASKYLDKPMAAIAYARMADAKFQMGDKDTAVQYFHRALEKAGTNKGQIINILRYMSLIVGSDETMKWCNEKLKSQPDSLALNLAMFNLYKIAGDYDKALEYIDKCIKVAADNQQLKQSYQASKVNILQEKFTRTNDKTSQEQVIKEYESMLNEQPKNTMVLNNLAYMLADSGMDVQKALVYAEKAYNTMPNSAEVLDTYGYVLLKNGKTEQANEFLQRALQQFEQNRINAPIEIYEHIGWVKEKLGQSDEALKAYKRAMESGGKNITKDVNDRISAEIERVSRK